MEDPVDTLSPVMDGESCSTENECNLSEEISDRVNAPDNEQSPVGRCKTLEPPAVTFRLASPVTETDTLRRRGYSGPPLLLNIPSKEPDGNYSTPFQFDRQAAGRISTSPTLRRLRRNMAAQSLPMQDFFDVARLASQKEQITSLPGHYCESPPWSPKYSFAPSPSAYFRPLLLPASDDLAPSSLNPADFTHAADSNTSTLDTFAQHLPDSSKDSPSAVSTEDQPQHVDSLEDEVQKKEFTKSARSLERRRSSVVVNLPGLEVFPGDLLVSDGASDYLYHSALLLNAEAKKPKWPFTKKGSSKDKHRQISDLENCLSSIKVPDSSEYEFYSYKDKTWNEFLNAQGADRKHLWEQSDWKKNEAVWELFTSECIYFLDHLLVLKMIFMNAFRYLQSNEYLQDVDLWRLFANLEELSQVSLSFVTCLFNTVKDLHMGSEPSSSSSFIAVLTKYFKGNLCQSHQVYCLTYMSAVFYLDKLKLREDFGTYLKWCEQNEQCKRLRLADLLVAPLHRLTRYPLLLKNIWKRTTDPTEKVTIYSVKEKVETSIRDLEGKVKWLDNSQKFRQLQEIIVWPPLWDRDKRFFVPEGLKHVLKENLTESILSSTNRDLLHDGRLALAESTRLLDVYLFLFDDFLLITKIKRNKKKSAGLENSFICPSLPLELQSVIKEGGFCKVLDQPIPLDRLTLKNIDPFHVTVYGVRHAFLIQHENRYQQCIAAFLLQAQTESAKKTWMTQLESAMSGYTERYENKRASVWCSPLESTEI